LWQAFSFPIQIWNCCNYAIHQLGIPEEKTDFVYDSVDHRFFQPENIPVEDYILAIGQEQRDYKTLIEAVDGTGLKLIICASSPWSSHRLEIHNSSAEVTVVKGISYLELKNLYARARLVVVPLFDSNYAAGVNTMLEAMAMGKPMIVTQSKGIVDYLTHDETGRFVSPARADEMRQAILSL
jgi:glycosyltransferase involved in cell wall biosynthesis